MIKVDELIEQFLFCVIYSELQKFCLNPKDLILECWFVAQGI